MTHAITGPIGIFDSGVGGLTILREIARELPYEDLIYLGDTARVPYGTKSPETVLQYTLQAASFLLQKKVKLLVLACHTACSHALATLQIHFPIPVVGVIQSSLNQLKKMAPQQGVAILGTSSTLGSGLYQSLILQEWPNLPIHPVACPLFVPLIEEGLLDHPATCLIAEHYLGSLRGQPIDAALLACTHYPLIRPVIQKTVGQGVTLIEPTVAQEVRELLAVRGMIQSSANKGKRQFYSTDDPVKFGKLAHLFFGIPVEWAEKIQIN